MRELQWMVDIEPDTILVGDRYETVNTLHQDEIGFYQEWRVIDIYRENGKKMILFWIDSQWTKDSPIYSTYEETPEERMKDVIKRKYMKKI